MLSRGRVTESRPRLRAQDLLVVFVSAAFVILGIALGDRVPWYATAFFAICLLAGLFSLRRRPLSELPPEAGRLTIDEVGITRTAKNLREHVAWIDIASVRIMTTDQGPWIEDVFFIIDSRNGNGCVVAHDLAVKSGLLEALQTRLEGLNNAAVIEAMTSIDKRIFTIWEAKDKR